MKNVKWKISKRWLVVVTILFLSWPVVAWVAAKLLIVREPVARADAIVLLSGSSAYKERAQRAAELYEEGRAPRIILTNDGLRGSWSSAEQRNPFYYESTLAELTRLGVPKEAVEVVLPKVSSTYDEATLLRKHFEGQDLRTVLIVTSAYHSRRALWTFRNVFQTTGIQIGIEIAGTGWQTPGPATWWLRRLGWQTVPAEYLKLIYYRFRSQ